MQIDRIDISQVNPAPYNPRKDLKPGDPQYEQLKRSIAIFDTVEPLVWNKRSGNLIGGHQRFKILKDRGDTTFEVSVVDLDDSHEKALNIALNKITGEWDIPKLKELLVDLDNGSFDLSITGFDEGELKDLIDFEGKQGLTEDDAVPEAVQARARRGQLWNLGGHRLFCGDATEMTDINALMGHERADMVFTDPPYNVDYDGSSSTKREKIQNDKMTTLEFVDFLVKAMGSYKWSCKPGASLYVCHPSSFQREFQNALEEVDLEVRTQIIWAKNTFNFTFARYKFQHEPIFYCHAKGESDAWYGDKRQSTLWHEQKPIANRLHPTMKPVELILRALTNSSKSGDVVLDFFGGSGSTLIACEKLNRRCFSMELDERYCDVILTRWEDFTGKKALLFNTEETNLVRAGK